MDQSCPVHFWRFAGPVLAGNLVAFGTGWAVKRALAADHPATQRTAAAMAGIAAFWLIGGLTWVAVNRRRP